VCLPARGYGTAWVDSGVDRHLDIVPFYFLYLLFTLIVLMSSFLLFLVLVFFFFQLDWFSVLWVSVLDECTAESRVQSLDFKWSFCKSITRCAKYSRWLIYDSCGPRAKVNRDSLPGDHPLAIFSPVENQNSVNLHLHQPDFGHHVRQRASTREE